VLSIDEVIEAMADHAFAALSEYRRYVADGASRIQDAVSSATGGGDTSVSASDVFVTSSTADTMTASQWAAVGRIRDVVPDASVVLRIHNVSWKKDRTITVGPIFGILVTQRLGPFTLRREFEAAF
jgi:hypothetical protein